MLLTNKNITNHFKCLVFGEKPNQFPTICVESAAGRLPRHPGNCL